MRLVYCCGVSAQLESVQAHQSSFWCDAHALTQTTRKYMPGICCTMSYILDLSSKTNDEVVNLREHSLLSVAILSIRVHIIWMDSVQGVPKLT